MKRNIPGVTFAPCPLCGRSVNTIFQERISRRLEIDVCCVHCDLHLFVQSKVFSHPQLARRAAARWNKRFAALPSVDLMFDVEPEPELEVLT